MKLAHMAASYPNTISDIDLDVQVASDGARSRVNVDRFTAVFDHLERGKRSIGFQPGWLVAAGSVQIGTHDLMSLNNWKLDIFSYIERLPLPKELCLIPQISGFLYLGTNGGVPELRGVLMTEMSKSSRPTRHSHNSQLRWDHSSSIRGCPSSFRMGHA